MNTFTPADFDFTFLEEGFCARDMVEQRINELSMSDDKDAFYVADLGDVLKKHLRWVRAMPRVTPFYAVKCNNSRAVVMMLASLGTGFDCASKNEIELVQSLGVDPSRIIYANPCKEISHLKYASAHGVKMMTFDSEEELVKVARCHENAKLVLRIATDDSKAVFQLSVKFGATLKSCLRLLERAQVLGLDIIGVSFHMGCGCTDPETYTQAISDARCVFDMGVSTRHHVKRSTQSPAELGYNMTLLDIGGGFPGSDDFKLKFEEFTAVINPALDKHFPADCGVQVIGEPGSYYVISAYMLAVNIIAKKVVMTEQSASDDEDDGAKDRTLMYYVNDGIYSSFNEVIFNPAYGLPRLHKKPKPGERMYPCSIWGQTCDGLDRIAERCILPDLQVGEWLLFNNMGAYSVTLSTTFNGFHKPDVHYVMSRSACVQKGTAVSGCRLCGGTRRCGVGLDETRLVVPRLPPLRYRAAAPVVVSGRLSALFRRLLYGGLGVRAGWAVEIHSNTFSRSLLRGCAPPLKRRVPTACRRATTESSLVLLAKPRPARVL
ncbi:hypothetical protein SKAU_G00419630 [Synaphobranchus kaupii]|uniref:ornithine decarboxylase n=1 Tax=Synaphobranchus kaupii TaxID=118154 RepID=A0A9Q1E6H1_SYNKA|nr:hypothetical protein SKAU_G00419630 [Synaphobranchus kaupii]